MPVFHRLHHPVSSSNRTMVFVLASSSSARDAPRASPPSPPQLSVALVLVLSFLRSPHLNSLSPLSTGILQDAAAMDG